MAKVAIAAAATDLMKVRFVFMGFLALVRTEVTLVRLCDGTVTHMTFFISIFQVLLKYEITSIQ
jgi:hypothetical protein